jgi:aminoglycoside phosphotransferase
VTTIVSSALAPDRAVPARDALLDPDTFADAVDRFVRRRGTFAQIRAARRRRARYQVGRSLRVLHELEVDGAPLLLSARTFAGDVSEIASRARERAIATGLMPPVLPLHDLGAVAWVYPNDRKIGALPELEATVAALLRRERMHVQLVAWAPEKSVVVRCEDEGETIAYAKAHAEEGTAVREQRFHDHLHRRLITANGLSIPRALACGRNVVVVEAVCGTRLARVEGAAAGDAFGRYGRALAKLHSLDGRSAVGPLARFDPERVVAGARLIGRVRPDLAEEVLALALKLAGARPEPGRRALLHGDAHPKNALDDGDRVALIDLEQLAAGDPAADIGGVLAALRYRSVTGDLAEETAETCEQAFLNAYAVGGMLLTTAALRWYTAAALLVERAVRAVTRVREEGLEHLPALLRDAAGVLQGGRS